MNDKYSLCKEAKVVDGHVVHRIQARRSFGFVKMGDLGGFVEDDTNLSSEGNCWVGDNACVYSNGKVRDDAYIFQEARVHNGADISEKAVVMGKSHIYDHARVSGTTLINGRCFVHGPKTKLTGNTGFLDKEVMDVDEGDGSVWV